MSETSRKQLQNRIEAGEARRAAREQSVGERIGEKAIEAKDGFVAFAREHPVTTVVGGLAVGVLVSMAFRGPRKAAGKAGSQASALAALGLKLAIDYAGQALHAADEARQSGAEKVGDWADSAGSSARSLRRSAARHSHDAADSARQAAREAADAVSRALRRRG